MYRQLPTQVKIALKVKNGRSYFNFMHLEFNTKLLPLTGDINALINDWDRNLQGHFVNLLEAKGTTVFINEGAIRLFKKDGAWEYASDPIKISTADKYKIERADKARMHGNQVNRSILKMKPWTSEFENINYNSFKAIDQYLVEAGIAETEFAPPPAPDGKNAPGASGS